MKLVNNSNNPLLQIVDNFLKYDWIEYGRSIRNVDPRSGSKRISSLTILQHLPKNLYVSVEKDDNVETVKEYGMFIPSRVRTSDGTIDFSETVNFIVVAKTYLYIYDPTRVVAGIRASAYPEEKKFLEEYLSYNDESDERVQGLDFYNQIQQELNKIRNYFLAYEKQADLGLKDAFAVITQALRVSGLADSEKRIQWLNNLSDKLDKAS